MWDAQQPPHVDSVDSVRDIGICALARARDLVAAHGFIGAGYCSGALEALSKLHAELAETSFVPWMHLPVYAYSGVGGDERGAETLLTATALLHAGECLWQREQTGMQPSHAGGAALLLMVASLALSRRDAPPGRRIALQSTAARGVLRLHAAREREARGADWPGVPRDTEQVGMHAVAAWGEAGALYARMGAEAAGATEEVARVYADLGWVIGAYMASPRFSTAHSTDEGHAATIAHEAAHDHERAWGLLAQASPRDTARRQLEALLTRLESRRSEV